MKCPKCGNEVADLSGEYYCENCGMEISDEGKEIIDGDNKSSLEQKIDEKEFYEDVDGQDHGVVPEEEE